MHGTELLTEAEAARFLRLGMTKVREERRAGRLPHIQIGPRIIRYRLTDLEAYIAAHARGGDAMTGTLESRDAE